MTGGSRTVGLRLLLLWLIAAVMLFVSDGVSRAIAPRVDNHDSAYYIVSHPIWTFGLPTLFFVFALVYLGPRLVPHTRLGAGVAYAHFGCMTLGALLVKLPGIWFSGAGSPARSEDPVRAFAFWNTVAAVGYGLILASLGLFAYVVAKAFLDGSVRRNTGG